MRGRPAGKRDAHGAEPVLGTLGNGPKCCRCPIQDFVHIRRFRDVYIDGGPTEHVQRPMLASQAIGRECHQLAALGTRLLDVPSLEVAGEDDKRLTTY